MFTKYALYQTSRSGAGLLAILAMLSAAIGSACADAGYTARIVGAQFAQAPVQNDKDMALYNLQHGGAELGVLIGGPDKRKIIGLDEQASEDRLQVTLLRGEHSNGKVEIDVWPFFETTDDASHMLVELKLDNALDADTTGLKLGGALVITTARSRQSATTGKVSLQTGQRFELGPAQVEIGEVGKPAWGGDQYAVEIKLKSDEMLERIAELEFFDAQGKPLKSSRSGTSSFGFNGVRKVEHSYRLERKTGRVTIEALYWQGLEEVEVPVNMTVVKPY